MSRGSGVLLHPSSLPGPDGIGDLGRAAAAWIEWLADAACGWWQTLPLGPTGYGDSPYQSLSSFAGNPLLLGLDPLVEVGLLTDGEVGQRPEFPMDSVDFGVVIRHKLGLLTLAADRFAEGRAPIWEIEYRSFRTKQAEWLEDFCLFAALKDENSGAPWYAWPEEVARRQPAALRAARERLGRALDRARFLQFAFERQWREVRQAAAGKGVRLIGDLPIYVAHDSADAWAHSDLFQVDRAGRLSAQAGVPPDAFSATGQLWGNPLYRWRKLQNDGYAWWIARIRRTLEWVDLVRLDHFLGFHAYWEVPAGAATAERGRWVRGPGAGFFDALRSALGGLPILAEDLGVISREAVPLRERFELPGMKILQFAFAGEPSNPFLPHNYPVRCAVYTGTHDNDTALGWYGQAAQAERHFCRSYLGVDGHDIAWDLIRAAWSSVAQTAIAPLQDVLSLGSEARMNFPGRAEGNWRWRVRAEWLTAEVSGRLREMNRLYAREARREEERSVK